MIISRTPLRVSFVGGGTDFPDFYQKHGGAVVSTTIDKYITVVCSERFDTDVRVSYSKTEVVRGAEEVKHDLVREALLLTGVHHGVDVATFSDVPAQGTGLGSSSAVTVGTLNALRAIQGVEVVPDELVADAIHIEIYCLGKPIGHQDQHAVSFGGCNLFEFSRLGVQRLPINRFLTDALQRWSMFFYLGKPRGTDDILYNQREGIRNGDAIDPLRLMRDLARKFADRLAVYDMEAIGEIVHQNWMLKKSLTPDISGEYFDTIYDLALRSGALGGKILGAGGGGFLMLIVPPEKQALVKQRLFPPLLHVDFKFTHGGTRVMRV